MKTIFNFWPYVLLESQKAYRYLSVLFSGSIEKLSKNIKSYYKKYSSIPNTFEMLLVNFVVRIININLPKQIFSHFWFSSNNHRSILFYNN